MFRPGAVAALAEDGEVRSVEDEPALVPQPVGERVDQIRRRVDDGSARVAHDVDVVVASRSVSRGPVPEMSVLDQADLLQQLEGAVDGRDVDVRDRLADLFRRGMAEPANGAEYLLTLGSHAQPSRPQCGGEVRSHGAGRHFGCVMSSPDVVVIGHRTHRR